MWIPGYDWAFDGHYEDIKLDVPVLDVQQDYEYHITIDYESTLFQTNSYYWRYLGWQKYSSPDDAERIESAKLSRSIASPKNIPGKSPITSISTDKRRTLPPDLARSTSPGLLSRLGTPSLTLKWGDVSLGTNIATGQIFCLVHITPPKAYLEFWWKRMWYYNYGEAIIKGSATSPGSNHDSDSELPFVASTLAITEDGRRWYAYEAESTEEIVAQHRIGGGFGDRGGFYSWTRLCKAHEGAVFPARRKK